MYSVLHSTFTTEPISIWVSVRWKIAKVGTIRDALLEIIQQQYVKVNSDNLLMLDFDKFSDADCKITKLHSNFLYNCDGNHQSE